MENSAKRFVLTSGSNTLTLDKESGQATLQRKMFLMKLKPHSFPLSDIDDVAVKSDTDGLSGAAIHHSVMHRRNGEILVLTTEEAKEAAATVQSLRAFLGMPA
jgi:hypothetical protein